MHYRRPMLTTEPIGSLPRPPALQAAMAAHAAGTLPADALEAAFEDAARASRTLGL